MLITPSKMLTFANGKWKVYIISKHALCMKIHHLYKKGIHVIWLALSMVAVNAVSAQSIIDKMDKIVATSVYGDRQLVSNNDIVGEGLFELREGMINLPGVTLPCDTTIDVSDRMPSYSFYLPLVFDSYDIKLKEKAGDFTTDLSPNVSEMGFFERVVMRNNRQRYFLQQVMAERPDLVRYNMSTMPRPPKKFVMHLDPTTAQLTIEEFEDIPTDQLKEMVPEKEVERANWLHTFDAGLQFSQAYVSPNWYQGGNSNLNMIANALYNVQLNPKFHQNVIFDTTVSYKLGLNNAPEDSIHSYNITEDIFQINSKFGLKAAKHWYYSVTAQFKTQLLNSYKSNTRDMIAAFLSPSELNFGVGMTYSYENPRKTVAFSASIAPLSYNLKTCTNPNLDPTAFGIDAGKKSKSEFGSSVELNFLWKLTYNITYKSRLFAFTDYSYLQADWEHTLDFTINRFMSARIYAHLRYDSNAPIVADTSWRRWQLKEIISIGFNYRLSNHL